MKLLLLDCAYLRINQLAFLMSEAKGDIHDERGVIYASVSLALSAPLSGQDGRYPAGQAQFEYTLL